MRTRSRLLLGLLLIIVGGVFMVIQVFNLDFDLGDMISTFWPVALILTGFYLIWRQRRRRHTDPDVQVVEKAFGNIKLSGADLNPDGIDAELGVGEIRIDLTGAIFGNKEHQMRVQVGIGEVKIILPKNIPISTKASVGIGVANLFGRRESGMGVDLNFVSEGYATAAKKLRITAGTGIGEIDICRD